MSVYLYEALVKTRVRMLHPQLDISDQSFEVLLAASRISMVHQLKLVDLESPSAAIQFMLEDDFKGLILKDIESILNLDWSVSVEVVRTINSSIVQAYCELLSMENYDCLGAIYGAIKAPPSQLEGKRPLNPTFSSSLLWYKQITRSRCGACWI